MKILQITNKSAVIHIEFEAGQQGKKNMMVKINRFLTRDHRIEISNAQSSITRIKLAGNEDLLYSVIADHEEFIGYIQFKVARIMEVAKIEDYSNMLEDVTITEYEVY